MSNPLYVVGNRELIQDPNVVEELDRISAFMRGALQGLGHVNQEDALEDGEDIEATLDVDRLRVGGVDSVGGRVYRDAGHPQGQQEGRVGDIYIDTNTGYRFQKCGGEDDSKFGWYYRAPSGPGLGHGPMWYGWQVGDTTSVATSGLFGHATQLAATAAAQGSAYVTGSGRFHTFDTSAVAGNSAYVYDSGGGAIQWWDDDFDLVTTVRTGASIADLRLWFGLADNTPSDSDTYAAAAPTAILFRYATSVPDAGWVGFTQTAAPASSASGTVAAIAASTIYRLRIRFVRAGTPTAYFSVNDGLEVGKTTNIPATGITPFIMHAVTTRAGSAKQAQWRSTHLLFGSQG